MRRLAAAILMVLLLTSCAPAAVTPITSGFSCLVTVHYDETVYSGTLEVAENTSATLVLTEPSTVAGLTMAFRDEALSLSYNGMELALTDTQIPAGAAVRLLCKALETAAQQADAVSSQEIQGNLDGVSYILRFDEQSGMPCHLEVPSFALWIEFSDWHEYTPS